MDSRDWMSDPTKKTEEYIPGVNEFLEFAFRNVKADGKIFCPCKKCANTHLHSRTSVYLHLTDPHRGFLRGYRQWIFHGERPTIPLNRSFEELREMKHDMEGLLEDAFAMHLMVLQGKFEFVPPINDAIREMLKSEMNDKWRQWKHDLKRAFDPSKTEEEIVSTLLDDRVDPGQYRALVHHWFSEEGQKISGINKQNHAKLEDTHCMGTKSLPVVIDEKVLDTSSKPNDQSN